MNKQDAVGEGWSEVAQTRFSRESVIRYAGAAQDFNAIHLSDEPARAIGFPNAIVHGMLVLGWALSHFSEDRKMLAGMTNLTARFVSPVAVGENVSWLTTRVTDGRAKGEVRTEAGTPALTVDVSFRGDRPPRTDHGPSVLKGDQVALRALCVERGAAARFAAAVGARDDVWHSETAAQEAGFETIPTVPTYAFALPALGFFPDDPMNGGSPVPDLPRECRAWARSSAPVVHAGQSYEFYRPLYVGMRVIARTVITGRRRRANARGEPMEFTEVQTRLEDEGGSPVSTSNMTLVAMGPQRGPDYSCRSGE